MFNLNFKFMKKVFYLLLGVFIFLGCGSDDAKISNESLLTGNINLVSKPKIKEIKINIEGELHRGKKWSKKNNVEPCTTSFGLCNVKVGIGGSVTLKKISLQLLDVEGDFARISFLENVDAKEGDVFFSKDDDYFSLPQEIAEELGYASFTIIPDDYITLIDEEDPFGYVDIRFIGEKL